MSDLLYKIVIESETLNGEIFFQDERQMLNVIKAIKADAFFRSEPELKKQSKWALEKMKIVPTKNHPLKVSIVKCNFHDKA